MSNAELNDKVSKSVAEVNDSIFILCSAARALQELQKEAKVLTSSKAA